MNWVDYTILGVLAVFLLYGFTRGFLRQILGIAGILGGLWLAARYAPALAESRAFKGVWERNASLATVIAYIAIFLAASLVTGIVVSLIWRKRRPREMGGTDSFLGGVLGAVQGVLILGGLSIALLDWRDPRADPVKTSVLAPRFAEGCKALVSLIPEKERERIEGDFRGAKKKVEESFTSGKEERTPDGRSFSDPAAGPATPPSPPGPERPPTKP